MEYFVSEEFAALTVLLASLACVYVIGRVVGGLFLDLLDFIDEKFMGSVAYEDAPTVELEHETGHSREVPEVLYQDIEEDALLNELDADVNTHDWLSDEDQD